MFRSKKKTALRGFEQLEPRQLLSASGLNSIVMQPQLAKAGDVPSLGAYTPAQIAHAYGFDALGSVRTGVPANGSGQTIAIVDAYDDPNMPGDLQTFDAAFGLPNPPSFRTAYSAGSQPASAVQQGWTGEITLDVEWAHAMAPGAAILLVEAPSANLPDLLQAVDYARNQPGVSVVSMSWGSSEFSQETSFDSYFTTPAGHTPVSFVAAAGDGSAPPIWPAASPNVLSVGGTTLYVLGAAGTYRYETGWAFSSGGISQYEAEPAYQAGVQRTGARTVPDVAYDADANIGYYVYDSLGSGGWTVLGGTSAGAPQWAALLAIANQGRAAADLSALRTAPADMYRLAQSDFHDVASGNNGYPAGPGYDLVTGRGTPYANRIVPDLLRANAESTAIAQSIGSISAASGLSTPSHISTKPSSTSQVMPKTPIRAHIAAVASPVVRAEFEPLLTDGRIVKAIADDVYARIISRSSLPPGEG